MASFPVGVLDLGALDVHGTLEVAEAAEPLGFGRFWVTEHHDEGSPHGDPTTVAAMIASRTARLRVGPAGVLLRYYTPLAVAHRAMLLEALFPGRVDFGVAASRAPAAQAAALAEGLADDDAALEERTRVLAAILRGETALAPLPGETAPPPVWISGNSLGKATLAASLGAGLACSTFHTAVPLSPDVFARYRDAFVPRPELPAPVTVLAVSVLCADSAAEVRVYDRVYQRVFGYEHTIVGTAARCAEALVELQRTTGADELVVAPRQATASAAIRGLALLADALGVPRV